MSVRSNNTLQKNLRQFVQKPCKKVWRIEKSKMILQEKGNLGTFFSQDCYVILKVWKDQRTLKTDLHVWLGSEVKRKQEQNAINLISSGNEDLQQVTLYRQVQAHETREFLDLFPQGVKYLKGSCSDYKQFEQGQYIKRLLHVKGKRNIRITQVPFSINSLNDSDSFILDDEWSIYCWNGQKSSKVERVKAIEVAREIRDEFCFGKAQIIIADQNADKKEERMFFHALGHNCYCKAAAKITSGNNDEENNPEFNDTPLDVKLYSVCDENGEVHREILHTKDSFIVDAGLNGIYVWVGSNCTEQEERNALENGIRFIEMYNYPIWVPVIILQEGNETKPFKSLFDKWPEKRFVTTQGRLEIVEKEHSNEFDANLKTLQQDMVDNARGTIKIWRVEGTHKVTWPREYYGIFYDGDVYIIRYKSVDSKQYIVYIWNGPNSDQQEQANGRKHSQQIDTSLKGKAMQVNVVYGKEPEHFLRLFKGRMVILMGGINSEYVTDDYVEEIENTTNRNVFEENHNEDDSDTKFFRVFGDTILNTKAVQIPPRASMLQSDDVFLLIHERVNYIWKGNLASAAEIAFSELAADKLTTDGDLYIFKEGYEPPQFWCALHGKAEYNKETKKPKEGYHQPHLFHCSNASGEFKVKEIAPFDQLDLNDDDVMILDTNVEIFLWIGKGANTEEKQEAWDSAMKYIELSDRSLKETCITHIKQGSETDNFISHFDNWDQEKAQHYLKYSSLKKQIHKENKEPRDSSKKMHKPSAVWGEQRILRRAYSTAKASQVNFESNI